MIKKLFYTLILVITSLNSNAQAKMTPIDLNDKLAYITDTLYSLGGTWGTKFSAVYESKKFNELEPCRKQLEKFLNDKIAVVKNMKDVGSSKDLRMGMVSFLQFELRMITVAFMPIERLNANSTDAQIKAAVETLTTESKKEAAELEKFGVLQEAYASKNGFKIEQKKEEKGE